jgi:diguanylate cyclase (GGDEF)-like protein
MVTLEAFAAQKRVVRPTSSATPKQTVVPVRRRRGSAGVVDSATVRRLHALSAAIGWFAALLAGVVLIGGWGFGIDALKSVLPGLSTMKANTALGIAALGANLVLMQIAGGRRSRLAARTMAGSALAIGWLTLAEYAFRWNIGIDQLLFRDPATPVAAFPGRPAAATALMIGLLAAAQLCTGRQALHIVRTIAALAASSVAWASLNGYVFGPQALREVPMFGSVALHTAASMLLLGIGVFAADPTSRPVRIVFARGTGGTICRWLLPAAVLAPPILGWLLSPAGVISTYPAPFRWAIYSAASSLGSAWLILLLAHRIATIDVERNVATQMSLHDPLTGLANRRAFDAFLLESFNLAKRHHHAMALVLIDIDRFKSYNDEFGHPAGDEVLKQISRLLSYEARETDLVARMGGEEFVIGLPETDLAGAQVIAERIRVAVERSALFRRAVTVSAGVAAVTAETTDTVMLLDACDRALYRAKAAGRNRVSWPEEIADDRAG